MACHQFNVIIYQHNSFLNKFTILINLLLLNNYKKIKAVNPDNGF